MARKIKVYIVGRATSYARFLRDVELVDDIKDANIVLFTGGEDVDPSLYGKTKHPTTYSNIYRDNEEAKIFNRIRQDQLALGICRGSQFLCVANGGILIQDCDNHAIYGTHEIEEIKTGRTYQITSTHHQMQYPYELDEKDYTLLFKATPERSSHYSGDGINERIVRNNGEAEIVLYHREGHPKCLAVQGHPEMIPDSPIADRINEIIYELL